MVAVLAIFVHDVNGVTELCHITTVPVCPVSVSKPLLLPEQMFEPPDTVPPTLAGFTVTVVAAELAVAQFPL